jgi:hypothetical protein
VPGREREVDLKFSASHSGNLAAGGVQKGASTRLEGKASALVGDDAHITQLEVSGDAHVSQST